MNHLSPKALQRLIQDHLLIETKGRDLVTFQLNPVQQRYNSARTNRDIILKARQEGFSSFKVAQFVVESLTVPNTRCVVLSHDKESGEKLLMKAKNFVRRFHVGEEMVDIPMNLDNKNEMLFEETNSTIYIGTPRSRAFGRGDTVHRLLLSEYAFYENPAELLSGILEAVPEDGEATIETTANGYNDFRKLFIASLEGTTQFKAHFFPWWEHSEYQRPGPLPALDAQALALREKLPQLTDAQLNWWLWKRSAFQSGDNPELFIQEYPSFYEEAFISSGNKVFSVTELQELMRKVRPPKEKGEIDVNGHFTPEEGGRLWLWTLPQRGKHYVVAGDVAEGLSTGDDSAAIVLDYETAAVVGVWLGKCDPDDFGRILVGIGRFYNDAVIGPESNNQGLATIVAIKATGYENVYATVTFDEKEQREQRSLGWRTNTQTKPLMIADLKALIRERGIDIPDARIIHQLLAFHELPPVSVNSTYRRMGAAVGEHDDLVIGVAIAVQLRKYTTPEEHEDFPTSYLKR